MPPNPGLAPEFPDPAGFVYAPQMQGVQQPPAAGEDPFRVYVPAQHQGIINLNDEVPLMQNALAQGITIHKSQGLTLEKAVVELGSKDFSAGLTFVAISWVKTLKGLAFHTHFDHARLKKPKETDTMSLVKRILNIIISLDFN